MTMGMFGAGFRPVIDPGSFMTMQDGANGGALDPTSPQLVLNQPRGLFGGGRSKWGQIAAGISDAVDPLTSHPTGGGQLEAYRKRSDEEARRKAQQGAFAAAMGPDGKFDPAKFVSAYVAGGGEPNAGLLTALAKPTDPLLDERSALLKAQTDAAQSQADRRSSPLQDQLLQMQIDAIKAQAAERNARAGYLGVKSAHPYAPQRPRAAAGAKINPNAVKWD